MRLALLLPDAAVARAGAAALRRALAPAGAAELLRVGPGARPAEGFRALVSAGPTVAQQLAAAVAGTDADWIAWCPPDRIGVTRRFALQAGIGAGQGAWFVTCGLVGRPRAQGAGGGPPAELIRPGVAAAWTGGVDVQTAVMRRDALSRLRPTDEVGAGGLVALATLAALEGRWLHVNHPVAAAAAPAPGPSGDDAARLAEESRTAVRLQGLAAGLEVVHASDSPHRDRLMQQLLPMMVQASAEWTAARRALDVRPVRPRWLPVG